MRDDFDVPDVHAHKVALTADQVRTYALPPVMKAKSGSAHHAKFTARHGDDVFELEALPPAELQSVLRRAIDDAIDPEAFNVEVDRERADAAYLEAVRRRAHAAIGGIVDADGLAGSDDPGRQPPGT